MCTAVINSSRPHDQHISQQYGPRRIRAFSGPVQSQLKTSPQPHSGSLKPFALGVGVMGILIVFFILVLCGSKEKKKPSIGIQTTGYTNIG